jgi:hypothetical protein
MSKIERFPGKTRPTALGRPAPVIDITWSNTDDGSWAVILRYSRYSDYCEPILDGIFSMNDAIAEAKRNARERHLSLGSDLGDGEAA